MRQIQIPYEDTTLPGYLFLVDDSGTARPTVIYTNGYDSTAEEAWFGVCCEVGPRLGTAPKELQAAINAAADWFWSDMQRGYQGRVDLLAATSQIVERALTAFRVTAPHVAAEIARAFRDRRDEFILLPGAVEAMETLRSRDVALALMTNGAGPVQRDAANPP